jgi:hypothetical protein
MAVTLEGTAATSNVRGASSIDASLPSGITSGELLILIVSTANASTVSTPTGWTSVASVFDGFGGTTLHLFRKAATGSEGSTIAVSISSTQNIATSAFRLSGHYAASPVQASGTNSDTSGADTAMTCPSVTTTLDGCFLLRVACDTGSSSHTHPAGTTEIVESASGSSFDDPRHTSAYATQATAGATGTAAFVASSGGLWTAMTVAILPDGIMATGLTSNGSSTDADSYATASVTCTANRLVLIAVGNSHATEATTPTVTGPITMVQEQTEPSGTGTRRCTVFRGMGSGTGAFTIDFGGVTQTACAWSVVEFEGVDTSGTNGSGAIVQSESSTSGTANSHSVSLSAFGDATHNVAYGAFANTLSGTDDMTPGSGFIELHDTGTTAPGMNVCTEWRRGEDTGVDYSSGTNTVWRGVALEIKKASAAAGVVGPLIGGHLVKGGILQGRLVR